MHPPRQASEIASHVEGLLLAVKATNDFEQEMAERFAAPNAASGAGADSDGDDNSCAGSREGGDARRQQAAGGGGGGRTPEQSPSCSEERDAAAVAAVRTQFLGSISSVFQPHLRCVVCPRTCALSRACAWVGLAARLCVAGSITNTIAAFIVNCEHQDDIVEAEQR